MAPVSAGDRCAAGVTPFGLWWPWGDEITISLRIGQVTGTNLQLGASYFQNFGALGSLHLEWNVVRGWPMASKNSKA